MPCPYCGKFEGKGCRLEAGGTNVKANGEKERCGDARQAIAIGVYCCVGTSRIACATGRQRRWPEAGGTNVEDKIDAAARL
jgi:hypothetical protein